LSLNACGVPDRPKIDQQKILHLNLSQDPVSLDPRVVRDLKDLTLVKQLFEGLMRLDAEGKPQPALAEKIEVSHDLQTYTFYLREAYWSNGDPVTAYDFAYAWSKVLDSSFASDYAHMLYPIKNAQAAREGTGRIEDIGVTVLNEKILVVELKDPTPYFLELTAFPTFFPVNKHVDLKQKNWTQSPGTFFVCNGPFCLKQWRPEAGISLQKNSLYWDKEAVHLDGIDFCVISDNNTESYLFEKNELDWLGQPISHNIAAEILVKMKEKGEAYSYPVAGTLWFKFNVDKEPFVSKNMRKAFSYAINRQEIVTHVLQGNQTLATGPLPPSMAVSETPYFKDGDIEEARKFFALALEEKQWTSEDVPKIVLNYASSERNAKIAQLVQQQLKKALGLEVELEVQEKQLCRRRVRQGLFQVSIGDWVADFHDPLAFLELFKYRNDAINGNGMNDTGWQDESFIALLDQSLVECDSHKRKELLREAEGILVEEMPIAPVYHYAFDYVKKSYVKDVFLSPLGLADFKTADFLP